LCNVSTLELREVVKHYTSGEEVVRAVDGLSLTIDAGQVVAIYGPSGSGKTTLLLLAAGLLDPDSGTVRFGGRDISGLSACDSARYRRSLGFVFQSFHLMPAISAVDNATLKLLAEGLSPAAARDRAAQWIARVGLADRAKHPPERLSMGERQRVAVARALANDPRLLLADEPTGNLDAARSRETLKLLTGICRDRGVPMLLVSHDPEAAAHADRVYDLRDGRLALRPVEDPLSRMAAT
jgi:ABC-type lipoprotein export system ATPase subunit